MKQSTVNTIFALGLGALALTLIISNEQNTLYAPEQDIPLQPFFISNYVSQDSEKFSGVIGFEPQYADSFTVDGIVGTAIYASFESTKITVNNKNNVAETLFVYNGKTFHNQR